MTGYRTVVGVATAEIEVKRSRFLAVVAPTPTEEAARELVAQLRRTHHDARHVCSASVIRGAEQHGDDRPDVTRSSDDGEPAGTAGRPILQVLLGSGLCDVTVAVVRWFGGTLLGAGGLARAYTEATQAGLAAADTVRRVSLQSYALSAPLALAGRLDSELREAGIEVLDTRYAATEVTWDLAAEPAGLDAVLVHHGLTATGVGRVWRNAPDVSSPGSAQ